MQHATLSNWMRRMAVLLAAMLMVTACGTADEDTTTGEGGEAPATDDGDQAAGDGEGPTLVTVPKLTGVSWFDRMEEGVEQYAEEQGANAYMQGSGQADSAAQVRVLEDLIAQRVDALNVVPFQPDAVESVLAEAMENDIVVIAHEAPNIENAHWDLEAFRNEDYGRFLMDELASRMGEEGQYATMVGSLSSATHMAWVESAIAHQEENYPDMEHVGDIIETSDDSQNAYERMRELLSAYPDLQGVQGSASTDVVGVGQAVEEAGLEDEIHVVGTSVPNDARDGLEAGSIDLIAFWDPAMAGYAMNVLAEMVMNDEEVESGADLGVEGYGDVTVEGNVVYGNDAWISVTQENVDEYDF